MKTHRKLLLATLAAGTMLTAFGIGAAPLSVLVSPAPDASASGALIHTVDSDDGDDVKRAKYQGRYHDKHDDDDDDDDDEIEFHA